MSISKRFRSLAAINGGHLFAFSQRSGLKQIGAEGSKGVCQAFSFFDGLFALARFERERTKKKDVIEYALHFQKDFEGMGQAGMWDTGTIRAKYMECINYLELQKSVRVGYVLAASSTDELIGFLYPKSGHFSLLLPNHVTGFFSTGASSRYFDPNAGTVSFSNKTSAFNFISDYHGSSDFSTAYNSAVGDVIVVQMVKF